MKKFFIVCAAFTIAVTFSFKASAQTQLGTAQMLADTKAKSDADQDKKAAEWVTSLNLNDPAKEARVKDVIATHLKTIRDWHNEHPPATVPAGINPVTGNKLSDLDRQVIANSAMPKSVHRKSYGRAS